MSYSGASPAVTLEYKSYDKIPYSIDLVPAIEFNYFPEPSKDWRCSWIPKKTVNKIRQTFHVVAKTHPTGEFEPILFVLLHVVSVDLGGTDDGINASINLVGSGV